MRCPRRFVFRGSAEGGQEGFNGSLGANAQPVRPARGSVPSWETPLCEAISLQNHRTLEGAGAQAGFQAVARLQGSRCGHRLPLTHG